MLYDRKKLSMVRKAFVRPEKTFYDQEGFCTIRTNPACISLYRMKESFKKRRGAILFLQQGNFIRFPTRMDVINFMPVDLFFLLLNRKTRL